MKKELKEKLIEHCKNNMLTLFVDNHKTEMSPNELVDIIKMVYVAATDTLDAANRNIFDNRLAKVLEEYIQ